MGVYRQKHYEMFAAIIKRAKEKAPAEAIAAMLAGEARAHHIGDAARLGVAVVQNEILKMFKEDNPRFVDLRFIEACGTGECDAPTPSA